MSRIRYKVTTKRHLEKELRDAVGLSRVDAKALLAGGWQAIINRRDAGNETAIESAIDALKEATATLLTVAGKEPETSDLPKLK